jgi:hypothetical protein
LRIELAGRTAERDALTHDREKKSHFETSSRRRCMSGAPDCRAKGRRADIKKTRLSDTSPAKAVIVRSLAWQIAPKRRIKLPLGPAP